MEDFNFNELLIREVKKHKCIYDTNTHHTHRLMKKRDTAWQTISTALGKHVPGKKLTLEKRYINLRDSFRKVRRIYDTKKSGNPSTPKPKWRDYELMSSLLESGSSTEGNILPRGRPTCADTDDIAVNDDESGERSDEGTVICGEQESPPPPDNTTESGDCGPTYTDTENPAIPEVKNEPGESSDNIEIEPDRLSPQASVSTATTDKGRPIDTDTDHPIVVLEDSWSSKEQERPSSRASVGKRKRKEHNTESGDFEGISSLLTKSQDAFGNCQLLQRDETLVWAESIGMKMQKMQPKQRALVRTRVEQILFKVEFGDPNSPFILV